MVSRPNFSKPNLLYYLRCFQLCFALAFLIVLCWCGVHRAWWNNITGALAIGVITTIITFAIIGHAIFTQIRSNPFSSRGSVYQIVRLLVEVVTFLLWIATVVLMLRPKGGCEARGLADDGRDSCYQNVPDGKWEHYYTDQPKTRWLIAVAFAIVECVSFIMSIFLVFKDNRANKVSGDGPSYA